MNRTIFLFSALTGLGLCWGLTIPLTRIAVLAGYKPFGLMAWQMIIVVVFTTIIMAVRGVRFPLSRRYIELFLAIAFFGTLIPSFFSYTAATGLPAGIAAIIIAFVPMFAMPIAVMAKLERWNLPRVTGLLLGAVAVILLAGPDALPTGISWIFVALALVGPLAYALEANYLAWRGDGGLDAFSVLWGASILGVLISVPAAIAQGQWIDPIKPWQGHDWAVLISGLVHCIAYTGYVWIVRQAGSVFASQIAYLVTATGILWSMLLLGERYGLTVWIAFGLMMTGVALVKPRHAENA